MKSFFEFYEKLKSNRLTEAADAMVPPNTGMGAAAGTAMTPAPSMAGGGMGAPQDMNLGAPPAEDAAAAPEAGDADVQRQTAAPEGEVDAAGIYGLMDQMKEFLDRFATEDDDEKAELKDDLTQKLDAIKNDFISLTGVEPPKEEKAPEEETGDEMGGAQPADTGAGLEQMTPAEAEGGGAPEGGMPGMPAPAAAPAGGGAGMGGPAVGGGGGFFGM